MSSKEQISTYYITARGLIKQNNPRAARSYILQILNSAVETYYSATSSIVAKVKAKVFLDKWIPVSKDLYDKGITDYVLQCFGLAENSVSIHSDNSSQINQPAAAAVDNEEIKPSSTGGDIDIAGIIDYAERSQGWCADIFAANIKAVVEIKLSSGNQATDGTGFIISNNGYLLTNDHIVFDEQNGAFFPNIYMLFYGSKEKYRIEPLFSNKKADLALCKFNPDEVHDFSVVKRIVDYSKLLPGAHCCVIGNAFGMGLAPIRGAVRIPKNDFGDLMYDASSNPGDSGGPVFNIAGECIGINKSKTVAVNNVTADGIANATSMDKIDELLSKWTQSNGIKL